MKIKRLILPVVAVIAIVLAYQGCSQVPSAEQSAPISAKIDRSGTIAITSLADAVILKGITANRGNCKIVDSMRGIFPKPLKFGDVAFYVTSCKVLEITVATDAGDYSFNWE
jgi:hypothetical protein